MAEAIYRVTSRAIIRDRRGRVLVLERRDGNYELPGGGWEYNETFEDCVRREVREELGAELANVGQILFMYRCQSTRWGNWAVRLAAETTLVSTDFDLGDDHVSFRFVDQEEFSALEWVEEELALREHTASLWS